MEVLSSYLLPHVLATLESQILDIPVFKSNILGGDLYFYDVSI